ncbi:MAG: SLBB domain-containing protein [Fibromonadaceae bacterium]|jgi:protein involved in polysaccharide export with SLBB domain|nr:SLBB domain-containing protein [Fibromonadaceae bacterium]
MFITNSIYDVTLKRFLKNNRVDKFLVLFVLFSAVFAFSQMPMPTPMSTSTPAPTPAQAQTIAALQQRAEIPKRNEISAIESAALNEILAKDQELQDQKDSIEILTLEEKVDTNIIRRYEQIIFSQSLPSAFYELQGIVPADYPLKPGDYLELSLWGAVERQFALTVNNQGNVFVEGAGLVNVANLNLGEAERLITRKLQTVYSGIVQGRISVNLRTTRLAPTKVFVMGFVQRPGGYDLPGNANVFLALYRAGGPSDLGSVRNIIIRRANGDSARVDLYDFLLRGKRSGEGILRDGDLVFVPRAEKLAMATGSVGNPAIYELKTEETLSDLISFAGGLLPNTDHTINLWRLNERGIAEVFEPGMAKDFVDSNKVFEMQNGDSIFVFTSTRPNENSIQVSGSVFYPGFYKWSSGMGISEAVALAGGSAPEAFLEKVIVARINPDSSFSYFSDDLNNSQRLSLLPGDKVVILDTRILKNWRTVSVAGYVKNPQDFEWQEKINALDLIALCGGFLPEASKSEIIIERLLSGKQTTQIEVQLRDGLLSQDKRILLEPGDRVIVKLDTSYYEQELVSLTGAFKNPGVYSLANSGETLRQFMNRVAILDPSAYLAGAKLFRKADILQEGELIKAGSNYRIDADLKRVMNGKDKDITLHGNDSIFIPTEMITVNVTGEVISPGHVLWKKGWKAKDYLSAAGGLTINGDNDRIVLTYANGSRVKANEAKTSPDPGSEIHVSFKPAPEPVKVTDVITASGSIATALTAIVGLIVILIAI